MSVPGHSAHDAVPTVCGLRADAPMEAPIPLLTCSGCGSRAASGWATVAGGAPADAPRPTASTMRAVPHPKPSPRTWPRSSPAVDLLDASPAPNALDLARGMVWDAPAMPLDEPSQTRGPGSPGGGGAMRGAGAIG